MKYTEQHNVWIASTLKLSLQTLHFHITHNCQSARPDRYLTYKRCYVCLSVYPFVCMRAMAGRTAGPIKTKLGMRTHVDPGSVLVKVKIIYLCVRYNRIHACATWRVTMARKRRENSSVTRDKSPTRGQVITASMLYFNRWHMFRYTISMVA